MGHSVAIVQTTTRVRSGSTGTKRRVLSAVLGLLLFASPMSLETQEFIGDEIACTACELAVSHLVTLGTQDGPGALAGGRMSVARDSRGRYWVISPRDMPLVFDSEGTFLQRISRRGEGPGEFLAPSRIAPVSDSMLVYDAFGFRFHIFGPDLDFVRSVTLHGLRSVHDLTIVDWPITVAINAPQGSADYVGWPLHFVSMDSRRASITASFGRTNGVLRPSAPDSNVRGPLMPQMLLARSLAKGPDGTLWAADIYDYTLTSWDGDAQLIRQTRRRSPLLPERDEPLGWNTGTPDLPPDPKTVAVRTDREGRLWIYTHVPSSEWQAAWTEEIVRARSNPRGHQGVGAEDPGEPISPQNQDLYATMVEVLDMDKGQVLARQIVPAYVIDVLDDGRLAAYHRDEIGVPYIDIYSVAFRAASGR